MRRRHEEPTNLMPGQRLKSERPCEYCGKYPDTSGWSSSLVFVPTHNKYWCGCETGRSQGAREAIRLAHRGAAANWAAATPEYDPDSPCPKCGNPVRTSEFKPHGDGIFGGAAFPPWPYVKRKCGRCTYSEEQKPLDFDLDTLFPPP